MLKVFHFEWFNTQNPFFRKKLIENQSFCHTTAPSVHSPCRSRGGRNTRGLRRSARPKCSTPAAPRCCWRLATIFVGARGEGGGVGGGSPNKALLRPNFGLWGFLAPPSLHDILVAVLTVHHTGVVSFEAPFLLGWSKRRQGKPTSVGGASHNRDTYQVLRGSRVLFSPILPKGIHCALIHTISFCIGA